MTALRDPAFYMMWKRVLKLFVHWQKRMPLHKSEDLKYPEVSIEKVDVDKLVTYFENSYMNVTQYLHQSVHESKLFVYKSSMGIFCYVKLNNIF